MVFYYKILKLHYTCILPLFITASPPTTLPWRIIHLYIPDEKGSEVGEISGKWNSPLD